MHARIWNWCGTNVLTTDAQFEAVKCPQEQRHVSHCLTTLWVVLFSDFCIGDCDFTFLHDCTSRSFLSSLISLPFSFFVGTVFLIRLTALSFFYNFFCRFLLSIFRSLFRPPFLSFFSFFRFLLSVTL